MTSEREEIVSQFEEHRTHLRDVAYRMLGSASDADDAVQEAWLRVSRAGAADVLNLRGWLTTVVARISLNMLRARNVRREASIDADAAPAIPGVGPNAEQEAELADSVGLALLVVLERLTPAERLAFVLHDMFDLPFEEIAPIVGRTPTAARQLASRARRRVRGAETTGSADVAHRRHVVEAFLSASRQGDFSALLTLLDPDVVVSIENVGGRIGEWGEVRGVEAVVAQSASHFARAAKFCRVALLNGSPGLVMAPHGQLLRAMVFTFAGERIANIEVMSDPARLQDLDISVLEAGVV